MTGAMRIVTVAALLLSVAILAAGCGETGKGTSDAAKAPAGGKTTVAQAAKPQTTCPIMGGKIVKTLYADHEGKRVYFCCQACVEKFKAEPAKYIAKLEDAGVTLTKTPAESE